MTTTEPQSLQDLLKAATPPREYHRGEAIYRASPDGLYIVAAGVVRVYRERNGSRVHMGWYTQGDAFGELCLAGDQRDEYAVALGPVKAHSYSRQYAQHRYAAEERFREAYRALLAERFEAMIDRRLAECDAMTPARTAIALLELAAKIGVKTADGQVLVSPSPTHEIIASIVDTSREVTTHNFRDLVAAGIIRHSRKEMVILDPARLRCYAEHKGRTSAE